MGKNIIIFSDGTGQSGGLFPDEARSNVYKLFRATRCGPESDIDPAQQFAFYDPGLGSASDGGGYRFSWLRKIYNIMSGATGLGITRNIIDCYAAIIRVWEPGDRIYLFGFSRGAYTARCVAGVLGLCGVPTRMKDKSDLRRDPATARAIAAEAVKDVYQHGSSIKDDPKKAERLARAAAFRDAYGSNESGVSNAPPYFIGVWDTVATLGVGWVPLIVISLIAYCLSTAAVHELSHLLASRLPAIAADMSWWGSLLTVVGISGIAYLIASFRYGQWMSLAKYRMAFYDTKLNPRVDYARHALAIDENRRDFQRVTWAEDGSANSAGRKGPERFKQIWFCGVHSDIGGSYIEPESRLSDISLKWMADEAKELPCPIFIDERYLRTFPQPTGMQHDERQDTLAGWPRWFVWILSRFLAPDRIGWPEGFRTIPHNAPLHPSVLERFRALGVISYGDFKPYRPPSLREHQEVRQYYQE
jgi:uncharacterized protein (DUF2235 family)